jgi:hypothetical protein
VPVALVVSIAFPSMLPVSFAIAVLLLVAAAALALSSVA